MTQDINLDGSDPDALTLSDEVVGWTYNYRPGDVDAELEIKSPATAIGELVRRCRNDVIDDIVLDRPVREDYVFHDALVTEVTSPHRISPIPTVDVKILARDLTRNVSP